jgi:hypothetical protein
MHESHQRAMHEVPHCQGQGWLAEVCGRGRKEFIDAGDYNNGKANAGTDSGADAGSDSSIHAGTHASTYGSTNTITHNNAKANNNNNTEGNHSNAINGANSGLQEVSSRT